MKKFFPVSLLSAALLLLQGPFSAADAATTLRLAHTSAPNTAIYATYEVFKKSLEDISKGKVRVQIFPSGQLGGDVPTAEAVLSGAIDICSTGTNNMAPFTELFFWADMPFIFKNMDGVHQVYSGEIGEEFKKRLEEETGFKLLFYANPGSFRNIMTTRKPIITPADLSGLKFRSAPSPVEMDIIRAIGATPTPIAWPESFMALEQRVVDGAIQQYHWAVTARWQEVTKFVTEVPLQHALHLALMSKTRFNSLPPDVQKAILEASAAAQKFNFENTGKMNDELKKICVDAGVQIRVATPEEEAQWRKLAVTVWEKYADKVPQALIDRILAAQK